MFCAAPTASNKCAKCHGAWYCGRQCQKAHWKTHKPACKRTWTDLSMEMQHLVLSSSSTEFLPMVCTVKPEEQMLFNMGEECARLYTGPEKLASLERIIAIRRKECKGWLASSPPDYEGAAKAEQHRAMCALDLGEPARSREYFERAKSYATQFQDGGGRLSMVFDQMMRDTQCRIDCACR